MFRHYAAAFAAACGLALADAGTVPTLFAEAWYDDGTTAWDEAELQTVIQAVAKAKRPAGS